MDKAKALSSNKLQSSFGGVDHIEVKGMLRVAKQLKKDENTRREETVITGSELVERVKSLVKKGNVSRLIIKKPDGDVLLEVPLTAGAVVGGTFVLMTPVLAAIGALAALLAEVRVEIVRTEKVGDDKRRL